MKKPLTLRNLMSPGEYQVLLEIDESGMIVAECADIPGCVSQGRTECEALVNIIEAIDGCLEARKEHEWLNGPSVGRELI